jgi:hypothetical protein
MWKSRIIFYCL